VRVPARGGPEPGGDQPNRVPDYILIPILLVIMSLGLVALIYWGGFVEERRNSTRVR